MGTLAHAPTIPGDSSTTLLEPDTGAEGYWTGAPCAHNYDGSRLLAVRERTTDERGHALHLYRHGEDLTRVRSLTADELGVVSVERAALATDPRTGRLVVYVPVDHGSNQWSIQRLDAVKDPAELDPATARDVLSPQPGGSDCVTVKDPYVVVVGGRYYMFYAGSDGQSEQAHLATSVDGTSFTRAETNPIIPRQYWHDHHTRVSCVLPAPDAPVWWVFYEGSATTDAGNTWNLRTALAVSHGLETIMDTSPAGPLYGSPTAGTDTGVDTFATFRYLDLLRTEEGLEAYYEVARPDGAFELRHAEVADE